MQNNVRNDGFILGNLNKVAVKTARELQETMQEYKLAKEAYHNSNHSKYQEENVLDWRKEYEKASTNYQRATKDLSDFARGRESNTLVHTLLTSQKATQAKIENLYKKLNALTEERNALKYNGFNHATRQDIKKPNGSFMGGDKQWHNPENAARRLEEIDIEMAKTMAEIKKNQPLKHELQGRTNSFESTKNPQGTREDLVSNLNSHQEKYAKTVQAEPHRQSYIQNMATYGKVTSSLGRPLSPAEAPTTQNSNLAQANRASNNPQGRGY